LPLNGHAKSIREQKWLFVEDQKPNQAGREDPADAADTGIPFCSRAFAQPSLV
jgi:hypothetical protein